MEYLSVRAFARHLGVADPSVREAIEKGRLVESIRVNEKGWPEVEREIGEREWNENRDPAAALAMELNGNSGAEAELNGEDAALMQNSNSFASRRAEREKWAGLMVKLAYEEKAGTLVEAKKVRTEAFNLARQVRDAMMNIPDRVAVELAAETDANKVHERLLEEIRIALRVIGGGDA